MAQRLAAAVLGLALVGLVAADDKKDDKPNPTGTWKWKVNIGGTEMERVLKLKLDGDKLTGTIAGTMVEEMKIDEPKYKDGDVSFKVTRDLGGNKFVLNYKGKVSGDTLKGTTEIDRDGEKTTVEFEAKRQKEAAGKDAKKK